MGLELVLPELPPIRTSGIDAKPVEDDRRPERAPSTKPSSSNIKQQAAAADQEECVTTPRSEDHPLKPAPVCPPAPRKPRPAKRRYTAVAQPPPRSFRPVPDDLASVFIPLPCPASKKIRVG